MAQQSEMRTINLLENPGFESGKARWTVGGTFALDTSSNIGYGSTSASWTPTGAQTFCSAAYTIPTGLYGAIGKAALMYKGGDATNYSWSVQDGSSNVIGQHLITTSTNYANDEISFAIPSSGSLKICVSAAASATVIYLDQFFLGKATDSRTYTAPEINLISNPNDAANWYSGANITVATTTTTSDLPLGNSVSGVLGQNIGSAIKITRASGTNSVYYRWTMPTSLKNRKLKVEWYQHALSGYASGDLKVQVRTNSTSSYGGTYTALALSTDSSGVSGIPNMDGKFTTTFDTDTSNFYELDITGVAGTTALVIGNVVVGPGIQPQGAVVGPVTSVTFTPASAAFGTVSNGLYEMQRVGEYMVVQGRFQAGTVAASISKIAMPTGYTINSAALSSHASGQGIGDWEQIQTAGSSNFFAVGGNNGLIIYDGSDTANIYFSYTSASNAYAKINAGSVFSNTSHIVFRCRIPIAEWAGSGTVNVAQNDTEYAYNSNTATGGDTTSFAYGPAGGGVPSVTQSLGTSVQNYRVRFQTPIQQTDKLFLEFQIAGTGPWLTPEQDGNNIQSFGYNGGNSVGVFLAFVNSTDVDVKFAASGASNTGIYASGTAGNYNTWASLSTTKWRVRKVAGGVAIGFGKTTDGSLGLVNTYTSSTATTFTFNGAGGTSPSVTLRYQRLGDFVTIYMNSVQGTTGTSSTTLTSNTALDAFARPIQSTIASGFIPAMKDNNTISATPGRWDISNTGIITIRRDMIGTAWTNSATAGANQDTVITYYVGTGS
jgi:hypothetical protein